MNVYAFSSGNEKLLNIMGMPVAQGNTSGTYTKHKHKKFSETWKWRMPSETICLISLTQETNVA